jgi:hypothetical protein
MSVIKPEVVPYGHKDFFKNYGAAWGFKDVLPLFYAPDGAYTEGATNLTVRGREKISRFLDSYLGFSPKCTVTFTNWVQNETGFAAEWIWEGTSDGPFMVHGVKSPQNGAPFSCPGIAICKVNEAGQLLSHKDYWDTHALLKAWGAKG